MPEVVKLFLRLAPIITILVISSCRFPDNFGFYQPITLSMEVPDGPPEYKAGWYYGCKNALGTKVFANAFIYLDGKRTPGFGSGIYQHDPAFQTAWGQGWFACREHVNDFVQHNWSFRTMPLE